MLMQLRLGEETLAAADAGMRLLAGVYAPVKQMEIKYISALFCFGEDSILHLPHVGN